MAANFLELIEDNPLLKHLYNNTSVNAMQVMDVDGYIIHINDAFQNSFGYRPEDLEGKHCRVLFTEEDQVNMMPEIEIENTKQQGSAKDRNYLLLKDRSCIWVSGESILTKDDKGNTFILKILQDIHQQKLLEKFLKDSHEFSDSVVKSISDALVVIDFDKRIVRANNMFYNLFDVTQSSLEGLYLHELKEPLWTSEEFVAPVQTIVETGSASEFNVQIKGKHDVVKHLSIKGKLIDGKLVSKKILLVITDITEKIESEQHRDDLIAFVVHELRNPLASITLCNQLIEQAIEENDFENSKEYIEKAKSNTQRINLLIRELFDATMAGSGNLQFNKQLFNFQQMVEEAMDSVQLTHTTHVITREGEADVNVFADKSRIMQVTTNYLINAIKYSPNANKVTVRIIVETGNVITAVSDYGSGIAEDKIPNIFDRYFRANKLRKTEGLGLGLFLSKQIIDAHKGRVWIESKEGEGSTFYFSIPL